MKKVAGILFSAIIIGGCYTAQQAKADKEKQVAKRKSFVRSHYEFEMTLPTASNTLTYEDSNIASTFQIGSKEIDFSITNKTKSPLKLIWDDASLGIFGRSNKVMHSGVKYIDRNNSYPPSTILPNTRFR